MYRLKSALPCAAAIALMLTGCNPDDSCGCDAPGPRPAAPATSADGFRDKFDVDKKNLSSTGRNPYWILEPGYEAVFESAKGQEKVVLTVSVLSETKLVDGVETRVVEEKELTDGKVSEDSHNYFAIDRTSGDVYYFGEDVSGAWLAGADGARFGLIMPAAAKVGDRYYHEIAPGKAMDRAEVVSISETVRVPAGEFKNCIKIEETSPLEPGHREYKYYAPGVGLIKDSDLELVRYGPAKK
jgi:hypothetical protein